MIRFLRKAELRSVYLPLLLPQYAFKVFEFVLPRLNKVCSRQDAKVWRTVRVDGIDLKGW